MAKTGQKGPQALLLPSPLPPPPPPPLLRDIINTTTNNDRSHVDAVFQAKPSLTSNPLNYGVDSVCGFLKSLM